MHPRKLTFSFKVVCFSLSFMTFSTFLTLGVKFFRSRIYFPSREKKETLFCPCVSSFLPFPSLTSTPSSEHWEVNYYLPFSSVLVDNSVSSLPYPPLELSSPFLNLGHRTSLTFLFKGVIPTRTRKHQESPDYFCAFPIILRRPAPTTSFFIPSLIITFPT